MVAFEEKQGMIVKTVGMVVHVVTVEEKCGISRLGYILIPSSLVVNRVSFYIKHAECILENRRIRRGYQKSQPKPTEYQELTPKVTDVLKSTVITGKIEPRNEVNVKPQISGTPR